MYSIKITGSGTKEEITEALQNVITSLIDVDGTTNFEDETLYTEINKDSDEDEN